MTKKIKEFRKLSHAKQSDALLHRAYKIPTTEMATKRAARLCSGLLVGDSDRLPLCLGDDHCGYLSCPRCRLLETRNFMYEVLPIIEELGGKDAWRAITIIPEFGKTRMGELPKGDFRGLRNQVAAAIRATCPEAVAAFCVDVSIERTVGQQEFCRFHVHGVIWTPDLQAIDQLHGRFAWRDKSEGGCQRPVKVERLTDPAGWLAYSGKPQFKLREQRPDAAGDLKCVKKGITIAQELMFVRAFSKFKAKHRFFYIGMKKT